MREEVPQRVGVALRGRPDSLARNPHARQTTLHSRAGFVRSPLEFILLLGSHILLTFFNLMGNFSGMRSFVFCRLTIIIVM